MVKHETEVIISLGSLDLAVGKLSELSTLVFFTIKYWLTQLLHKLLW